MNELHTEAGRRTAGSMTFDEAVDELKRILDSLRSAVLTDLPASPAKL